MQRGLECQVSCEKADCSVRSCLPHHQQRESPPCRCGPRRRLAVFKWAWTIVAEIASFFSEREGRGGEEKKKKWGEDGGDGDRSGEGEEGGNLY